ncbi:tetratricopeptide repeat protein [Bariatricus massiliensis]|uniref:Tetratricopeptide repeat protein n=1 Tax=Bariatricus massiliensis TaxID=1745713 RepID=A0ABS8DDL8_9FIRM|nr:tetratricopeptide repeat protein [Bariatricus massiliensis]MCB7302584.1 tetratricopeptide repeat protein [Bariatricus massiliensis]MCB7373800.1 tetratricopeptide repeat protein [Bariatricus massiliensis]MCB7386470.1 tetratricopeptide repeat protein [Bariatricus massiliensis]MCB7410632.1 tetratricopeptide repeat protein [Bariatricus massiliensis]MCQ5253530.1 tetratricopeptide repeat protein [Bariatricus massiliensis]
MDYTERLAYQSNYWYNDGLKKANIRDLSGAVSSLRRSLQYNRENIMARNLLGLVYYGRGEVVEALVEWIISKNFKSYENIANYYIKKVQETPSELETINQAIHKYNQCLIYCQQNGEDLAIIQLKKVVAAHPTFLKAHQLLALLYLHTEQYAKARQILRRAHKMDTTNEITLSYMHELAQIRSQKVAKLKEDKNQTVSYNLGNETIIQPASASLKDNAGVLTIVNILIGIAVGAAVIWFLIVPSVNQKKAGEANRNVTELSEQIASKDAQINALKKELEGYRSSSDEAESAIATAQSTQESYEKLMTVYNQYQGGNTSNADMLEGLLAVTPDALGEQGKAIYGEISGDLFPKMCERLYAQAQSDMEGGSYGEAVTALESVIRMDEGYDEGKALKLLGDAYAGNGDAEKAKETYEKVTANYSGTDAANEAQNALSGTPAENNSGGEDNQ